MTKFTDLRRVFGRPPLWGAIVIRVPRYAYRCYLALINSQPSRRKRGRLHATDSSQPGTNPRALQPPRRIRLFELFRASAGSAALVRPPWPPRSRTKPVQNRVRGGRIPLYARGTVRSQQIAQPSARRGPRASGPSIPYPGHPTNQISAISRTTVQYTGPRMGPSDDRSKYGGERRGAAWQVQRTACCVQAGQLAWCHLSVSLSLSFSLSLSLSISLTHVRS
jgi:hypothetical protein